jgi:hypothetical protein
MGHNRLGTLPDTAPWRRVVALIADNADVAAVARGTTTAALDGLEMAKGDAGLIHSFWLLTQVAVASRQADYREGLRRAGILVAASSPDLFEVVSGFSDAVDRYLDRKHRRTDIGEMGQLAAVESLTSLLRQRSSHLFEPSPADVRRAARELSTQRGFGTLAHDFFARFKQSFLTYHLGRELANHVGGNGRFVDQDEHDQFVEHLRTHCREAAGIMQEFAGDWYSKGNYEGGITPVKARNFVNYTLVKLQKELAIRGNRGE